MTAINIFDDHKAQLNRCFPEARLADVINRTRPTGPGNRRTTQFSLQVRPLLKHDAEDGRRHFFVDHVFCIFKKKLMKYVVLEFMCMCLPCITLFFCVFARFSTKHSERVRMSESENICLAEESKKLVDDASSLCSNDDYLGVEGLNLICSEISEGLGDGGCDPKCLQTSISQKKGSRRSQRQKKTKITKPGSK